MASTLAPPPRFDPDTAAKVWEILDWSRLPEAPDQLGDVLHSGLSRRLRRPILLERLGRADLDRRTALIITFAEQLPVRAAALGDDVVSLFMACGLLEPVSGAGSELVRSPFMVARLERAFVIADPVGAEADTVMPVGPGTARLAHLLPASLTDKRVLDLCSGPGSVALVAASRHAHVVATDLSERCAAFMRANALLNDVAFDIRLGDLYAPVEGERFDVVSCHPPYVELPSTMESVLFLHGGETGSELPYRVLAGLPSVLAEGGEAVIEFHASDDGDTVNARVEELFAGTDCEAALFSVSMKDPDVRAVNTAGIHDPDLGARFDEVARSYRQHLEVIGREGVAALAYVRRRRPEWTRQSWKTHIACRDLPGTRPSLDAHIATIDTVAKNEWKELLDTVVRAPDGATLVMEAVLGTDAPATFNVHVPAGTVAARWELTEDAATLLRDLAGAAVVRDVLPGYAARTGREVDDALENEVIEFVVRNLLAGVLVLA